MAERFDVIEVLGGKAQVYRRVEGGIFYFYCFLQEEKHRFRRNLKTLNPAEALGKAEQLLIDILAKERHS